jgi:hypothetical protein
MNKRQSVKPKKKRNIPMKCQIFSNNFTIIFSLSSGIRKLNECLQKKTLYDKYLSRNHADFQGPRVASRQ